jgi:hypothetical protein
MTSHRGPRSDAMDPRRTSYDARQTLLSLSITIAVATLVFAGFYLFSSAGPKVPTGPAVTQPINSTPPPAPRNPTQAPTTP